MSVATENSSDVAIADGAGQQNRRFLGSFACTTMGFAGLILIAIFSYGTIQTGDFKLGWPWLTGQRLVFKPTQIELGTVEGEKWIETEVYVINLSKTPVKILGSQKSCGCIGVGEFPVEIPANTTHSLKIRYATLNKPGTFEHFVKYFMHVACFLGTNCSTIS